MPTRRLLALAAFAALAACAKPETPEQRAARLAAASDSAKTAIEAQNVRFARYAAAGQGDSLATLYAPGAVVMPPNAATITNRDSLVAMLGQGPFTIALTSRSVWSDGASAAEYGTFTFAMTPPGAPAMNSTGKYMARWEKVNGEWLMTHDIWNDDAPMAPVAPAPARRRQ